MKVRDYSFDNVKFILIILVVFAHFLEICNGYGENSNLYRVIYSFHMPVMFFLCGYFAKFNKKRIAKTLVLYIVFQILYITFSNLLFDEHLIYQIVTPYWLLWYLLVYLFYLCLIPILDFKNQNYEHVVTVGIISLALYFITPYIFEEGEVLAILRFFTFLPYFILGFYSKKIIGDNFDIIFKTKKSEIIARVVFGVLTIISVVTIIFAKEINCYVLYGTYAYEGLYSPAIKLILLICSLSWIGFFVITLRRNKNIPIITGIGGNTITIFLLHGFIVKAIERLEFFKDYKVNVLLIVLSSLLIVFLLGCIKVKNLKKISFISK